MIIQFIVHKYKMKIKNKQTKLVKLIKLIHISSLLRNNSSKTKKDFPYKQNSKFILKRVTTNNLIALLILV